jgi:hypothetical protein
MRGKFGGLCSFCEHTFICSFLRDVDCPVRQCECYLHRKILKIFNVFPIIKQKFWKLLYAVKND